MAVPFFSPGSPVSFVRVAMEQPVGLVITGSIDQLVPGVPAEPVPITDDVAVRAS